MINWQHYRNIFPATTNHTYFMTAGAGPIPTTVLDNLTKRYQELSLHGGDSYQDNIDTMERCRQGIAKLINAHHEDIAFIPNVSFGMNAIAHSLNEKLDLLIPEEDFPSSIIPWKNIGYNIKFISSAPDLQDNINSSLHENTAGLITSFVQYSSGYKVDLTQIKANAPNKLTMFLVNATQGISVFPIDVQQSKIDILICACQKWLFCGEGISFMYINREFFKKLRPAIIGWRSSPFAMQFNKEFTCYQSAKAFEIGWLNMANFTGLEQALKIVFDIGVENIAARVNNLVTKLIAGLTELHIPIVFNGSSDHRSGIVLLGPFKNTNDIMQKLREHNILVTKRGEGIRIAIHFYNNESDIDRLLSVMKLLLKYIVSAASGLC